MKKHKMPPVSDAELKKIKATQRELNSLLSGTGLNLIGFSAGSTRFTVDWELSGCVEIPRPLYDKMLTAFAELRLRRVVRAAERWDQCKSESFSSMDHAYVLARQRLSDAVAAYRKGKKK